MHFSEAFAIIVFDATVAQLVEQLIRNQQVRGSSPLSSLKKLTGGQLFSYIDVPAIELTGIIP